MINIIDTFDWRNLRSADSSIKLPEAIQTLVTADNDDELDRAYWSIDNESVVQGILFQSALAVVCCLPLALHDCKAIAKPYILELLVQLTSGIPAQTEIALGNADLLKNIRSEVSKYISTFLQILDDGNEVEKSLCIDIVGICALEDSSLKPIVKEKFDSLKGDFENDGVNKLIDNWLIELV